MDLTLIIQTILAGLSGGGVISLIEFLIRRKDERSDRLSEVLGAIAALKGDVAEIRDQLARENADDARRNILLFDDELRRGLEHSEESYDQILDDMKFYERYCSHHKDYENNKAANAIRHINDVYVRVKAENKFI